MTLSCEPVDISRAANALPLRAFFQTHEPRDEEVLAFGYDALTRCIHGEFSGGVSASSVQRARNSYQIQVLKWGVHLYFSYLLSNILIIVEYMQAKLSGFNDTTFSGDENGMHESSAGTGL